MKNLSKDGIDMISNVTEEVKVLGPWLRGEDLPIHIDDHKCVVVRDHLYLIGEGKGSKRNAVYRAPILEDGSLGLWVRGGDAPTSTHAHQCVVVRDRLYLIGGYNGSSGALNTVYYAPILEDGSLGDWVQDTNLPISSYGHRCVVIKDRLYMVGGSNGSALNTVYYAPILEDGSLGTWIQDTNLPIRNSYHQCVVIKDRLYMICGWDGPVYLDTVYYAPILEDGSLGDWVKDISLLILTHSQCVVTKDRVYMIGGWNGFVYLDTVYYAPILEDGSLGTWVQDTNLPIGNSHHQCVVTKDRLYVMGGYDGSVPLNNVYYKALTTD